MNSNIGTRIIVYGDLDTLPEFSFPTEENFIGSIEKDIFDKYNSRYQTVKQKGADIIVLTRTGKAYGYFVVTGTEKTYRKDLKVAERSKLVNLVKESVPFKNPVVLKSIGITGYQVGKSITQKQFEEIKKTGNEK